MLQKILFLFFIPIYLLSTTLKNPNKEEKTIFLTFDDGPTYGTQNILTILEEEKVPATLFLVGKNIVKNNDTYLKILASNYVSVANHTYSHANSKYKKFYSNKNKLLSDLEKNNTILTKDTIPVIQSQYLPVRLAGRNVFRLPHLSSNDYSIPKEQRLNEYSKYNMLEKKGFFIYGWDIEWEYSKEGKVSYTPKELVNQIEHLNRRKRSKLKNKIILLMHDFTFINRHNGKKDLQTFIRILKQHGWKFETIEKYL